MFGTNVIGPAAHWLEVSPPFNPFPRPLPNDTMDPEHEGQLTPHVGKGVFGAVVGVDVALAVGVAVTVAVAELVAVPDTVAVRVAVPVEVKVFVPHDSGCRSTATAPQFKAVVLL